MSGAKYMMGERTLLDDFTYRYSSPALFSSILHVYVYMFVFACMTLHSRPNTFSFF